MNIQDKITYSTAIILFIVIFITALSFTQLFIINDRNNKLIELTNQNKKLKEFIEEKTENLDLKTFLEQTNYINYIKDIEDIIGARIIITDSNYNFLINTSDFGKDELLFLLKSPNQIYRFFTFSNLFTIIPKSNLGKMVYENIGNKKYYASIQDLTFSKESARIENSKNSNYLLILIKEQNEIAIPPLRYMFNLLLIFLIAGLISIIVGTLVGKNISGPILKLNKSVSRISDGDYSENIRIRSTDEIGILARNINLMKNKIQKSHESLKEFTYILSHEIKNMLTSINGYTVGITEGVYSTKEEIDEALNIIKNKTKDLENITESLLMLSKIENKIIEVSKEKIDIIEIVDNLVKFYEKELKDNKLNIIKSYIVSENLDVLGDKYLIQTVLSNLINNAIKYSSINSNINISISNDEENLIFSVSNKGYIIPDEEKNKIFNVFYRSKKYDFKNIKGFGLGLAISKKIAAILDGELNFNSENDLNTFIFKIPISTE